MLTADADLSLGVAQNRQRQTFLRIHALHVFVEGTVEYIQDRKTGQLFELAVYIGAVMGRASSSDTGVLLDFARNLGLAYQTADDVYDAEPMPNGEHAKPTGMDIGKPTAVQVYGVENAKTKAWVHFLKAFRSLDRLTPNTEPIRVLGVRLCRYLMEWENYQRFLDAAYREVYCGE